jgi:tryptophan synthase alpha chain
MSRIAQTFTDLKAQGRKALIPYITAGDPDPQATVPILLSLAEAGADVIELGIPFSDPAADGPVIQQAAERALAHGVGMAQVLQMVSSFRHTNTTTPIVLMGYANPIERYGATRFVDDAKQAGVDGVLVVDYPPEECEAFAQQLRAHQMDPIFLLAPTSSDARIARMAQLASGYVYCVSLKGVTGAGHLDVNAVAQFVGRVRAQVHIPVGVGFGIADAATARAVAEVADAVVMGSALIKAIQSGPRDQVSQIAGDFLRPVRTALNAVDK